jgi:hypothetical protein
MLVELQSCDADTARLHKPADNCTQFHMRKQNKIKASRTLVNQDQIIKLLPTIQALLLFSHGLPATADAKAAKIKWQQQMPRLRE